MSNTSDERRFSALGGYRKLVANLDASMRDHIAGLPDQVARLSASGLTSDELAYRLAHDVTERLAEGDTEYLHEAQAAAHTMLALIPQHNEAARPWSAICEAIERQFDRIALDEYAAPDPDETPLTVRARLLNAALREDIGADTLTDLEWAESDALTHVAIERMPEADDLTIVDAIAPVWETLNELRP